MTVEGEETGNVPEPAAGARNGAGGESGGDASEVVVDAGALLADIRREAGRLRSSGVLPPGYERELAEAFRRLAPARGSDAELERALRVADESSFIQSEVPIHSATRGVTYVKRLLRKLMAWYVNHLGDQVQDMGQANARVLRLLAARVEELESRLPPPPPFLEPGDAGAGPSASRDAPWGDFVVATFARRPGRVLVVEAGDGSLVDRLVTAGVDAYGVEPHGPWADVAQARGLDVWADDPMVHLEEVGLGSLAGLVLSGVVDRRDPAGLWRLLESAAGTLSQGAPLVVIGTNPSAWASAMDPVRADLLPGRPLHAATWRAMLVAGGFESVSVEEGEPRAELAEVAGESEGYNANIRLLNRLLFGPERFAVAGVRNF